MIRLFILSITFLFTVLHLPAQNWGSGIKGEGEIVKQEITLPALDGIALGIAGNVILTPGTSQKVVIEAQQNIIDNIKRDVKDGSWGIYGIKSMGDYKTVTIYITLPSLEDIHLSGSGSIKSTGTFNNLDDLDISVSGSGEIILDYASRSTDLHISGSGEVTLKGKTGELDISISGSGDVFAKGLSAASCDVHISGSGDAQVQVNGELEAHISGSGDVRYTGNASVQARVSGSGTVSKM